MKNFLTGPLFDMNNEYGVDISTLLKNVNMLYNYLHKILQNIDINKTLYWYIISNMATASE